MIEAIGTALTAVIGWAGDVVASFVTADGALYALLPLLAIGIAFSVVMFGVKVIRGFIWGA